MNLLLKHRRELLVSVLAEPEDPLRLSPLLRAPSGQVLEAACKLGLEGLIGKRNDSIYEPGERSGAWIKHRTNREQEFVIAGYIPSARGFDALLVGVYGNKQLLFVAKVKDGSLMTLAATAGGFLLITWVATKTLFFFLQETSNSEALVGLDQRFGVNFSGDAVSQRCRSLKK